MSNPTLRAALLPKPKFQIIFSCIISLLAVAITWGVSSDNSPFHDYAIWHVWLPNIWGMLNFIPSIFGFIVSGNVHAPSDSAIMIGVIVQWFILGFLLSNLTSHLFNLVRKS